jgi:hypothetical protein
VIDQNAAHDRDAYPNKMSAILPVSRLIANQAQVSFVHQGCRLQCVAGAFVSQLKPGKTAEFVDDERYELIGGLRIARRDLLQQYGHFARSALH